MDILVHFLNVGCGNMVLLTTPNGATVVYDCDLTLAYKESLLAYLAEVIGPSKPIDIFINSHPHPDHIRGIGMLHRAHPIKQVWDIAPAGQEPDTMEYEEYQRTCEGLRHARPLAGLKWRLGLIEVEVLNARISEATDLDEGSLVVKMSNGGTSVLLTGDTSAKRWRDWIVPKYGRKLASTVLLASHHGCKRFFRCDADGDEIYEEHIKAIAPELTVVSTGPNARGLPDPEALGLYAKHSGGEDRVWLTQDKGHIRLRLSRTEGLLAENPGF